MMIIIIILRRSRSGYLLHTRRIFLELISAHQLLYNNNAYSLGLDAAAGAARQRDGWN